MAIGDQGTLSSEGLVPLPRKGNWPSDDIAQKLVLLILILKSDIFMMTTHCALNNGEMKQDG